MRQTETERISERTAGEGDRQSTNLLIGWSQKKGENEEADGRGCRKEREEANCPEEQSGYRSSRLTHSNERNDKDSGE
jgi:hypothetical protein